ncbi:MAG: DUF4136 domain-containing protein [Bacteroidetes bacterium]|nr:DUF4136 domain-containing protein [Bacteroidota bacterium]
MKQVSIFLVAVGILVCSSCAVTDFDHTANFAQYRSFVWGKSQIRTENPVYKSDLIDSNIKANIKNEFAKKGITYDAKKPDLLVNYEAYTEKKEQSYGGGFYYYPYYYPYYPIGYFPYGWYMMGGPMPYWGQPQSYYSYTQGTLVLDIKDKKTGRLIWRGFVHGTVDNAKTLSKSISKGVKAIMKKYPAVPPPLMPIAKEKIS